MRSSTSSAGDQFKIIEVPVSVVVNGAITSVDPLRGKSNRVVILAGEQILVARIKARDPRWLGTLWVAGR
jgi:hypothetical protein